MNQQRTDYVMTAVVLGLHVLLLAAGFNVLVAVFQFPEILREPALERFSLFAELSAPVNAALAVWFLLLGLSLLRTPVPEGRGAPLGWKAWAVAAAIWAASIAPAMVG